jgi:hypothetical protein
MICDYSVWHTTSRLSASDGGKLPLRLCEGDISGVAPHPEIAAFYSEITALHPEINDISDDQVDDTDLCAWNVPFDRSSGHITMCCGWSKADYVRDLVSRLAAKHGLAFYDPQSGRVTYPDDAQNSKPWWKIW